MSLSSVLEELNKATNQLVKLTWKWALIAFVGYALYLLIFTEEKFGAFMGTATRKAVMADTSTRVIQKMGDEKKKQFGIKP